MNHIVFLLFKFLSPPVACKSLQKNWYRMQRNLGQVVNSVLALKKIYG